MAFPDLEPSLRYDRSASLPLSLTEPFKYATPLSLNPTIAPRLDTADDSDAMASVLALDAFARTHYPHLSVAPAVPRQTKAATGGPVYYRQHEVIQLVEVPAPPKGPQPSTITSSSMPSSSAYTESCGSESSEESEAASSYCSSDEGDDAARAYYDDSYNTRICRIRAWRDGSARALSSTSLPRCSAWVCADRHAVEPAASSSPVVSKRKQEDSYVST